MNLIDYDVLFLMSCIKFAHILFKIFAFLFIRDIGLQFSVLFFEKVFSKKESVILT